MALKLGKYAILIMLIPMIGLGVLLLTINPNDYKSFIEDSALNNAGLTLDIEGNIGWSFFPIGFAVEDLSIYDQDGELFTRVEAIQLAVNTFSLIRLEPRIEGIHATGAKLFLTRDKQGFNNWDNLVYQKSEGKQAPSSQSIDHAPVLSESTDGKKTALFIPAQHIHLQELSIHYLDAVTDQDISIDQIDLEVRNAALDQPFSANLSYHLSSEALSLNYAHQMSTQITVASDLNSVKLIDLVNNVDASGAFGNNRAVKLSLTGDVELLMESSELIAHNIQLSGAGLAIDTNFRFDGSGALPFATGDLSIAPFALSSIDRHLLLHLGVNSKAFQNVSFQTPFELKSNRLTLPTFDLKIDQSQFIGRAAYHIVNKNLDLTVKGDQIKIDNYLAAISPLSPPTINKTQVPRTVLGAVHSPSTAPAAQSSILPLDTMRNLTADVSLTQDSIEYEGITVSDISLQASLSPQALVLESLKGTFFDGQLESDGAVTLSDVPIWKIKGKLDGLNLEKALEQHSDGLPFSAQGNLNGAYLLTAKGNDASQLLATSKGKLNFDVTEGALTNINLDRHLCEGVALINQESLSSNWVDDTHFKTLTSKNTLSEGRINTKSINIETTSLQAYGSGSIALKPMNFDYALALKPLGKSTDSACRINPKWSGLEVPVICSGSLQSTEEPAPNCALDNARMSGLIAQLAKDEASRKVEKELDRGLEKELGKYIDKDSELGQQLKKSILGIFSN